MVNLFRCVAYIAFMLVCALPALAADRKLNVLLLVSDDQSMQAGCYGTPALKTPAQDAIAARGVRFDNNYCPYPSCSPSRASILTGVYPHQHGITRNVGEFFGANPPLGFDKRYGDLHKIFYVPQEVPTLVEAMNAAGYVTGITHKFHIVPHDKFPFQQWLPHAEADDVKKFIASAGDKPFFLMVNFASPHRPFAKWIKDAPDPVDPTKVTLPGFLPDVPVVRQDYADYLTSVQYTDRRCAEVIEGLDASGAADNTLVIYLGDNGAAYQRGKYSEYDFGLRCPLIIAGPGVREGGRGSAALTNFVDVMPTILDYTGVTPKGEMHGVSLRNVLENKPDAKVHDLTVSEVSFGKALGSYQGRGATDGKFQYIRRRNPNAAHEMCADDYQPKPWGNPVYDATVAAKDRFPEPFNLIDMWQHHAPAEELFDLQKDPWTLHNVAREPAYADDLARMRKLLDQHIDATHDTLMQDPPRVEPKGTPSSPTQS